MDDIKCIYTLNMKSENNEVYIKEVISVEDDNIYAMGALFKQFLKGLTYEEETINKILRLENIDG